MRWHGLIPRRQEDIARSVAEIVESQLLSQHVLEAEAQRIDLQPYIEEYVTRLVYGRIGPRLARLPLLGRFAIDRILPQIEQLARDEMRLEAAVILKRFAADAEKHLPVRRIVEDKIRTFDIAELETIIHTLAKREFRQIEWLGGILGFGIGLIQVGFYLLIEFLNL